MAIVLKDRVKVSSGIIGTGPVTLGAAAVGYQDFSVIGDGNVTYYTIALLSGSEWEVGQGTVTQVLGVWYLSRDVVLESSNANTLVNFTAGTKDVFVTYPAEKAIYEEASGNVIFDGGPITVVGTGVTSYTSFANFFAEMFGDANTYVQQYIQNQNSGSDASADYVALNDIGTDSTYYVDMGMNSSGYSSATFQIYTPNSGYVYSIGGGSTSKMFVGSADDDLILHAGGFAPTNIGLTVSGTDQTVAIAKDATIGGTASVTGAADFASTVLLSANPTLALQAATKQYVDNQVTAGLHIHEPVRVETTGNLTAGYTQGGTTFNITDITGTKTLTTSVNHGLNLNEQIWLYNTAGNGLSINTAYFVYSTPALNQLTVSLTFGGAEVTGLTNAAGLAYNTRANSGVGAKLTNSGAQVALSIDNVTLASTNRVMVRLQTNPEENGVYTVTNIGSGATNWELTRATDSDMVNPADPNGVGTGDYYFTQDGDLNAGDSHVLTTEPNTMILGYTDLTYTQFSGGVTYTGVAPIDVTGQLISLTGTVAATNGGTGANTVATGDLLYGSATDTWSKLPIGSAYKSLLVNAGGTNVEWNALALNQTGAVSGALPEVHGGTNITTYTLGDILYSSATNTLAKLAGSISTTKVFLTQTGTGAVSAAPAWGTIAAADVSGLAPSATTDTTNAANITSGTLPTARLSGSYTGITGVGTLAAGTWNGSVIAAVYGGTGQSSYAVGDLVYADTTTSLAKLSDVISGNALISGGVGAAPVWGKIGLTTHVSGTLAVGNGGTGATTLTGYVYGNGTGAMTASTSIPNAATTATSANTASAIVARDASGDFAAGTITAALNGNATTATTAANVNNGTLTMAVSGTGLSGSATFTANQSGSSSFTVTSNATDANTASAIVARDASGNFAAGTITAALSGNATTATSATSAATATSLAGGAASQIPYQSGAGATAFIANGTAGQVLTSAGAGTPTWSGISGGTF